MILALLEEDGTRPIEIQADGDTYTVADGQGEPLRLDALQVAPGRWSVIVDGRSYEARLSRDGNTWRVRLGGRDHEFRLADPARAALRARAGGAHGPGRITAPMPGRVLRLLVQPGQKVSQGEGVVVVEAMKMENELAAPRDGVISEVLVKEGQAVEGGAALVVVGDG
jgi:biotin carboxyl carrier protein